RWEVGRLRGSCQFGPVWGVAGSDLVAEGNPHVAGEAKVADGNPDVVVDVVHSDV
ncbi:hypothetical protein A2U01_0074351, partial [Trifolium medium]|nr:hypothetical protein [Trifolium medium]